MPARKGRVPGSGKNSTSGAKWNMSGGNWQTQAYNEKKGAEGPKKSSPRKPAKKKKK